jgi:membrane-bound lytic murein transglycosylase B
MRFVIQAIALAFFMIAPASSPGFAASAQELPLSQDAGFRAFLDNLRPRARAAGVSQATLDAVIPTLSYNSRVIELDRQQPGSNPGIIPSFAPYAARHVDADRINRGRARYQMLRPRLALIEARTGVPESIMMAIYGHETNYGSYTGDFDLLRSLATLAYDGRRRVLFTDEFIATLLLMERGIPRSQLKGSWAGATGYPQFLPSMYIRLAVDGDGDGRKDIWRSETDALASIGNYLVDAGWRRMFRGVWPRAFPRRWIGPRSGRCSFRRDAPAFMIATAAGSPSASGAGSASSSSEAGRPPIASSPP